MSRPLPLFWSSTTSRPSTMLRMASTMSRYLSSSSSSSSRSADAVVVGGGPGGIAVVGNLLDHLPEQHRQISWVDPAFAGGRVNGSYREVPSNTKVDLFLQFASAVPPLQRVVDTTPKPNAITALQALPGDKGCYLSYAADMCLMLSDGIPREFPQVQQQCSTVKNATLDRHTKLWKVGLRGAGSITTPRLILCTGSNPVSQPLPIQKAGLSDLHLDTALTPTLLAKTFSTGAPATVAVIGASHSAILVLMNLFQLASSTHPQLRVKWFSRHKNLRYAEYMDGWILRDNTGLKGQAAEWARNNLEEEAFASSPVSKVVTKIITPSDGDGEKHVYEDELGDCTHIVQAIGYRRNPIPALFSVSAPGAIPEPLSVEHNSTTGGFFDTASQTQTPVPGLFGAGIAFPQKVTDPYGNVEHAVGFWKFMNFCKKVVPEWAR